MEREPEAMREIHRIREQLYEEQKNLTPAERVAKINREADEAIRKYGLKLKKHHSLAHS